MHRAHERGQVAFHEDEAGAVHGDIGAGAHGNADIGRRQSGGVVQAVAGKDHPFAAGLVFAHQLLLAGGGDAGVETVEFQRLRHGARTGLTVAGDHVDFETFALQLRHGARCGSLDGVGQGDEAGGLPVDHDRDERGGGVPGECGVRPGAADNDQPAGDPGTYAGAGFGGEFCGSGECQAARLGGGDDGAGQRMLARRLGGGRQAQQFTGSGTFRRLDGHDLRPALGEGAGLVDQQHVRSGEPLEGGRILDEHARLRAAADAGDQRDGRRQPECAGARDDQDGDGVDEPVQPAAVGGEHRPGREADRGDCEHDRHKPPRDAVGEAGDGGFAFSGGLD